METITNKISVQEIMDIIKLHPLKVKNIYLFGSRVYRTNREDSDYDFIVVANNMIEASEIKGQKYNIHIHTPDKFKRDLANHDIHALECIYAPDYAKLQVKENYPFVLNKGKLIKSFLTTSHSSWHKAKLKLRECDIYLGTKSAFHAMRILVFGIQIAKYGSITDFSEANHFWKEMDESNEVEWDFFQDRFFPAKLELEKQLKNS